MPAPTAYLFLVKQGSASINLSKATRLKDVTFRAESPSIEWITMALQTITPEHRDLRQISFDVHYLTNFNAEATFRRLIREAILGHWLDLDRLLVRLWESHSIRPKIICATPGQERQSVRSWVGGLLPETTRRGVIDLIG